MNIEFVQETVEDNTTPRIVGTLTGWEVIVFTIEDDPDDEVRPLIRRSDCARSG